jgi:acyl carrier protein
MTRIEKRVVDVLARAADLPPESLDRNAPLASLGIESLERIECVLALEDELHIELPEGDLHRLRTVEDLIQAVRHATAHAARRSPR